MEEFLLDRPRIKEREIVGAIPFSPELKKFPDWVLLDRFGRTHCYNDPDAAAAAVANDFTVVPVDTSSNQSGYFSFTLRSPPEVSYVDLHWPYGVPGSVFDLSVFPSVVSSDENLVLLRIVFCNQNHTALAPELFVYKASPSAPRSPSLQPLPTIGVGQIQGLADRKRFLMVDSDMGILCRSGDPNNYLVADLSVSCKGRPGDYNYTNPHVMDAVLCTFSSKKRCWTVNEMLAPQPHDQGRFPDLWYCDRVLPFAGRFLCWVDYYSGIVFCDFSDEDSPVLRFVHVPGNQQYSNKTLIERYCPESFRNVSVSQGMMRFVHIGNDRRDPNPTSGPTITVWNLMIIGDSWNWEIHHMINLCDLWGQKAYKVLGFPLVPPEFPVVTKDNPDVVCCVLRKDGFCGNTWIINVDMKQVSLRPCVRYINEQIACNGDAIDDGEYENYFPDVPFLSSDFSRYLNKPPGTQYIQQPCKVIESPPSKWINKKWKEGFHVMSITTAGSCWGVVMSRNSGYSEQVVELDFLYPSEGMHRQWENAYRRNSTVATADKSDCALSIPNNMLMHETQETLRMTTFPSNHEKIKGLKLFLALINSIHQHQTDHTCVKGNQLFQGGTAGGLSGFMFHLPKLPMAAITKPSPQVTFTMTQLSNDMRHLQMIMKHTEFEQLRNHLSDLIDALNKGRCHMMPPVRTVNAGKFLHGFIKVIYQAHKGILRKSRADDSKEHEMENILRELKHEEMTKDNESRWLADSFWREQERLRPKIDERDHEQSQMNTVYSQTPQCDKKGNQSVISVEGTKKKCVFVNHMGGVLSLYADTNNSSTSLKKLIENDLGYSLNNFTLRFGCRILDNQASINSLGITHNATLDLYPKLCGGCERDSTLAEFVHSGIELVNTIQIPDPHQDGTVNVQNLSAAGCRLAKSLVDIFVKAFREKKTWHGNINISDFIVHFGRAELTKAATGGGRVYEDWQKDCKKLAAILKQIFTDAPLYMKDLLDTLEGVSRTDMHLNWLNTYLQNHFAFAPSYNRSNVLDKIMTMYESLPTTAQGQVAFRNCLDKVSCGEWTNSRVRQARIFRATMQYGSTGVASNYGMKGFSCFKFQRNFTKHASEEKVNVNGGSKFSWTLLEYVVAYVFKNFVPQAIKALLGHNYPIDQVLESAVPF